MKSLRTCLVVAVLAGGLTVVTSPLNAALLSDLINPQSPPALRQIEIGDKVFDNFTVTVTGLPTYDADPANIQVTGIVENSVLGLHFTSVNTRAPIILAHPGAYVDVIIGFDVAVVNSPNTISDLDLSFDGSAPSDGLAQIVETASGGSDPPVLCQVSTLGSATATVPLTPSYPKIHVDKDIAVIAGTNTSAQVNEFTQFFHQVPEPAMAALLAFGGLVAFGRRVGRKRAGLATAIGLGLAALLIQPSTASAVALSTLDNNNTLTGSLSYGDLTFSNFHFNVAGSSGRWIADTNTIDVQGFTTPDGSEDGLRFAGLIATLLDGTSPSSLTLTISYDVAVKPGTRAIDDVTMSFNGAPTGIDGGAQVDKTVESQGVGVVGSLHVWNQPSLPVPRQLQEDTVLTGGPYTTLSVTDQIVVAAGESGATTISFINQTFSEVPEPAALALLVPGIPALLYRRRH